MILPEWRRPNIGSRVLSPTERRVGADWQARFGHPLLLLETFVDPQRFHGGVYRAANGIERGLTLGYRRTRAGYGVEADTPKRVFVRPLCRHPQAQLTQPTPEHLQLTGVAKIMLNAEQMRSLPQCFTLIADPRRSQGRRHRLPVVLGIAAGARLCGMRGYKAISDWAEGLGQQARERFGCRRENGHYVVPSEFVIRDCLVRIEPDALDRALNAWNRAWGKQDKAIPLLKTGDIAGKDVTGDALLTPRARAIYLIEQPAHYHFTVKGNPPTLERDIRWLFEKRDAADVVEVAPADHGRIQTRGIGCSTALNAYLDFPHVGQVFLIERESIQKKTGEHSREMRWESPGARCKRPRRNGS